MCMNKKKVDCFLTSHNKITKLREYFEELTIKSLQLNGYKPIIIRKKMLERYFYAEKLATTKIYIVCDNDVVFPQDDTLDKLIETMKKHPEIAILGLGWKKDMSDEKNSSWKLGEMGDVWEFDGAGGCLAIRKGILKDMGYKMEFENYGDDRVIGRIAREKGYKVGVAHKLYFINLGQYDSSFKQKDFIRTA